MAIAITYAKMLTPLWPIRLREDLPIAIRDGQDFTLEEKIGQEAMLLCESKSFTILKKYNDKGFKP